jgi:hypothetical protein
MPHQISAIVDDEEARRAEADRQADALRRAQYACRRRCCRFGELTRCAPSLQTSCGGNPAADARLEEGPLPLLAHATCPLCVAVPPAPMRARVTTDLDLGVDLFSYNGLVRTVFEFMDCVDLPNDIRVNRVSPGVDCKSWDYLRFW